MWRMTRQAVSGRPYSMGWQVSARLSAALQLTTLLMLRISLMAYTRIKPSLRLLHCNWLAVCSGAGLELEPVAFSLPGLAFDTLMVAVLPTAVLWGKNKHGERLFWVEVRRRSLDEDGDGDGQAGAASGEGARFGAGDGAGTGLGTGAATGAGAGGGTRGWGAGGGGGGEVGPARY